MKKSFLSWKSVILGLAVLPGISIAQDYNDQHHFATNYSRSVHTCAVQLNGSKIVEGGTIVDANSRGTKVVELGIADPSNGQLFSHPLTYAYPGLDHHAADLIESLGDPGFVVCAANLSSDRIDVFTQLNIFKTDPSSGAVSWSILYKSGNGSQIASAIAKDREKSYFVVGKALFGGRSLMYLIKIKDDGTPLWERYYSTGNRNDMLDGVDVIFDGTNVVVVGNLTTAVVDPSNRGIIIARINPADGSVVNVRHLTHLNGNQNLKVRDLELVNGNYVMVGEYNPNPIGVFTPQLGFMVIYNPLLNVSATEIYGDPANNNLAVTGVEPGIFGGMYMSFDLGTDSRANYFPGIMQTNATGTILASEIYRIKGYLGSNGLVGINNLRSYMIKGSTDATSIPGAPSLSMIGQSIPLSINLSTCNRFYELRNQEVRPRSAEINLFAERDETANKIDLVVEKVDGKSFNCMGGSIGSFRLARPAGVEENEITTVYDVYPNPSNGNISINFTDGRTAAYQFGEVYNLMGEVVANFSITNTTVKIDLSKQTPGVYLLRMKSTDGTVSDTKRLVIK